MSGSCLGARLTALVDGALDHEARERAHAHLARCERCRAQLESERAVKRRLAGLAETAPEPPDSLTAALLGLAVPGVEPAAPRPSPLRGTRPVSVRPRGGDALLAPAGPTRPPRSSRRAARRLRRAGALGGSLLVLGVAAALALGEPASRPTTTPVDPGTDAFVVDFASTSGEVPLLQPASGASFPPR